MAAGQRVPQLARPGAEGSQGREDPARRVAVIALEPGGGHAQRGCQAFQMALAWRPAGEDVGQDRGCWQACHHSDACLEAAFDAAFVHDRPQTGFLLGREMVYGRLEAFCHDLPSLILFRFIRRDRCRD